jgi:hypothetical protein
MASIATPMKPRAVARVKLHALTAALIPISPKCAEVEHQSTVFQVCRPHPSDPNGWRGEYAVYEVDMTDYYASSVAEVRQWVRLVSETITENTAKKSA